MFKTSFIVMALATLGMVSAAATDSGCYGSELNHNASLDREQCIQKLISQTGVNLHASYGSCQCSASGIPADTAAKELFKMVNHNTDPNQNRATCFANVGDCFDEHNIRTCGSAQVDCGNI
ncbi:hypothetical protein BC941DRAFT_466611 [Chlamydoabsidia padenii]|nr:hypothetical protein BC941DRAFT_466611 [Chlamydoabsidia padenii]